MSALFNSTTALPAAGGDFAGPLLLPTPHPQDDGGVYVFKRKQQAAILGVLLGTILLCNGAVLVALSVGKRRASRINFFIGHLAVADLLVGVLDVLPELIWRVEGEFFSSSTVVCKLVKSSMVFSLILSSNILVALSIDRFYVIVYPMKLGNEGFRSRLMVCVAWGVALLETTPVPFLFHYQKTEEGLDSCLINMKDDLVLYYVYYCCVISYAGPALIILACYVVIIVTVARKANSPTGCEVVRPKPGGSLNPHKTRLMRLISNRKKQVTTPESLSPSTGGAGNSDYLSASSAGGGAAGLRTSSRGVIPKAKLKTIKMTVIIVAAFTISWSPYWVYTCTHFKENVENDPVWVIIQNLACLNSAADPLIYAFFTTNLWKEFRRLRLVQLVCGRCCDIAPTPPAARRQTVNTYQPATRSHTRPTLSRYESTTYSAAAATHSVAPPPAPGKVLIPQITINNCDADCDL